MKLIVGLGNKGQEYTGTRHNVGFKIVNSLPLVAATLSDTDTDTRQDSSKWKVKKDAAYWEGSVGGQKIVVIKPQTYMNVSGGVVANYVHNLKINPKEDLWVIHDDLDLPIGVFKIQKNVSAAGHNGVKSIIEKIGHQDFIRFRFGIGRPTDQTPIDKYVLQKMDSRTPEQLLVRDARLECAKAILYALKHGIVDAMNRYNVKNQNSAS